MSPAKLLAKLFADERAHSWRAEPLAASAEGMRRYDDRLACVTAAAHERNRRANERFMKRLGAIPRSKLTMRQQVSYDLFQFMLSSRATFSRYREWRMPLNSDSGFHSEILFMHELAGPKTVADYENYIARLNDVPRYFDENIANMREGMREGFTLPSAILDGVGRSIDGEQYDDPTTMPLWQPFANFPHAVPDSNRPRLAAAGRTALTDAVIPAYARFQRFFEDEYRPAARTTTGAASLPDGRDYYADLVRYFTTLPDATPESVHETGVREVGRIRAEMAAILRDLDYSGDLVSFLEFLRTDPQFRPPSGDALLREAAWIAKEIDGKLPAFFGKLPRMPYAVKPVPEALAPNYTAGRYNPGPLGAAGEYWVNTYAPETRLTYTLPALTLHEAVPGHHLQIALSRELTDLPVFRLNFFPHAFGEGWALYCEKLGEEMGVYHTPYQRFGRLTYEIWRACRLVVDTGMHAMGWTREQAHDYLAANTSLSMHEVRTEIDRYIAWPGQALAYKVGELKIVDLRKRAEEALGTRFDVRAFHDAVLEEGGVTLALLERRIGAHIEERRKRR